MHFTLIYETPKKFTLGTGLDLGWDLEYFPGFRRPPPAEDGLPLPHRPPLAAENERVTHAYTYAHTHRD